MHCGRGRCVSELALRTPRKGPGEAPPPSTSLPRPGARSARRDGCPALVAQATLKGGATMSFFCSGGRSSLPRAGGFRGPWCAGALWGTLMAVLLLAWLLGRPLAEQPLDTAGWTGAQFLEHLERRGVQLRVVRGA